MHGFCNNGSLFAVCVTLDWSSTLKGKGGDEDAQMGTVKFFV